MQCIPSTVDHGGTWKKWNVHDDALSLFSAHSIPWRTCLIRIPFTPDRPTRPEWVLFILQQRERERERQRKWEEDAHHNRRRHLKLWWRRNGINMMASQWGPTYVLRSVHVISPFVREQRKLNKIKQTERERERETSFYLFQQVVILITRPKEKRERESQNQ